MYLFCAIFLLWLLKAILERPFLTMAGIKKCALPLSLATSFLGATLTTLSAGMLFAIGPSDFAVAFWFIVLTICCSVGPAYLSQCCRQKFAWGWIAAGNVCSLTAIVLVIYVVWPVAEFIEADNRALAYTVKLNDGWIGASAIAICVAAFLAGVILQIRLESTQWDDAEASLPALRQKDD